MLGIDWQRPNRTEEWAYERCRDHLPVSRFFEYVGFPWATLIDAQRREQAERTAQLTAELSDIPPRTTLIRATVCQHIWAMDMIEAFKTLGITDLFWSHATRHQTEIDGIRLHPFPLYPVRCFDGPGSLDEGTAPRQDRDLLYSFAGAHQPGLYISEARQWIFDLPERDDACVIRRGGWHYERDVYGTAATSARAQADEARAYADLMHRSIFSLCPSGSGPNSIRFWESLGFGAIPVLISDTLRLPGYDDEWANAIVHIEETREAVESIPAALSKLAADQNKIRKMQHHCAKLWQHYGQCGPETLIQPLTDTRTILQVTRNAARPNQ